MAQLLDKQGFQVLGRLRQTLGRLRAKPDKFKLNAFYETVVEEIEEMQTQIAKLEADLRGGR